MARLYHSGAELGHDHAEGLIIGGEVPTYDTTIKRSGARSYRFETSTGSAVSWAFTGALARTYYLCGHFWFPSASGMPTSASTQLLRINFAAGGQLATASVTSAGKVRLENNVGAQIGSDSAATLTTDTWYRLEVVAQINSGASDDTIECYLDGTLVASGTGLTIGTAAPGRIQWGYCSDPGTSEVVYVDDIALNDSTGSVNNGLVGNHAVYALFPTADSARANWVNGGGGNSNLFDAVDNIPPTGVSTGSAGATTQVKDPDSNAANTYEATMTTYTAAGIGASDIVTAIFPVVAIGSSSTTGSDTITHEVLSNPVIAGTTGSCDIVCGTYPTSWNRIQGVMTENPTVTLGTAPVMKLFKNVATTRTNTCCLMAMVVSASPPSAANYAVPLGTIAGAGLAVTLLLQPPLGAASGAGLAATLGLGAPTGAATGAGLAPTPQANVAPPLATAAGAGLVPSLGLAAPLGTAVGAASVPTLALLIALATATGQGLEATFVTGGAGETFTVDLGTAIAAGLLPEIRVAVDAPLGSAAGSGFSPSLGLSAPLGGVTGDGFTPSLGLTVPLGSAAGAGLAPTPRAAVAATLATALAAGLIPSVGITVPLGLGSGVGIAPARLVLLMPLGTATALGIVPTIPGLSEATYEVDRATATGAGLTPIVRVAADVPLAGIAGSGLPPIVVVDVLVPVAGAAGAGLVPVLTLLVPVGSALGIGYVPVIVGLIAPNAAAFTGRFVVLPYIVGRQRLRSTIATSLDATRLLAGRLVEES